MMKSRNTRTLRGKCFLAIHNPERRMAFVVSVQLRKALAFICIRKIGFTNLAKF